jgi:hypothetical protein
VYQQYALTCKGVGESLQTNSSELRQKAACSRKKMNIERRLAILKMKKKKKKKKETPLP